MHHPGDIPLSITNYKKTALPLNIMRPGSALYGDGFRTALLLLIFPTHSNEHPELLLAHDGTRGAGTDCWYATAQVGHLHVALAVLLVAISTRRHKIGEPLSQERLHGHITGNNDGRVCLDARPQCRGDIVEMEIDAVGGNLQDVHPDEREGTDTEGGR